MKVNKVKRAIIAVFAVVFAFVAPIFAANVAKIGDVEYATMTDAVKAWKNGDVIKLLCDLNVDGYFDHGTGYVLDGCGHTIKCLSPNTNYPLYFVNANNCTVKISNVTIDVDSKVPWVVQSINNGFVSLDNVTLKGGKTLKTRGKNDSYAKWHLGYGIHINKGKVEANNLSIYNCEVA